MIVLGRTNCRLVIEVIALGRIIRIQIHCLKKKCEGHCLPRQWIGAGSACGKLEMARGKWREPATWNSKVQLGERAFAARRSQADS